jgi:dUTP pyrophosphatase
MKVKIKKVNPDAITPEYKTDGSAGCDIHVIEEVVIKPKETILLKTGLSLEFSNNYLVMLVPRSSFCMKNNLDIPNSIGIGDSDYRGEYLFAVRNLGDSEVRIKKHERIAQFVFFKVEKAEFEEVKDLEDTERGEGGFGSTGKS